MADALLAIDPGESTGWSLWAVPDDAPMMRLEYGLVHGGRAGFQAWSREHLAALRLDIIVCERFNPHLGYGGAAKDYTPLYIEGQLDIISEALAIEVIWQDTSMKDLCRDAVLKREGLYIQPAQAKVDEAILWQDARDVNDSMRHALAWAKAIDHDPTVRAYWPEYTE